MPIVSDDGIHDTKFDYTAQSLPPELKRVYITSKEGSGGTEKPAGEFKPNPGTTVPNTAIDLPKAPYGIMGELELGLEPQNDMTKGINKFIAKTAKNISTLPQRAIENSQESLNSGNYDPAVPMEAAMTVMTGSLPFARQTTSTLGSGGGNVNSNYIEMFMKEHPEFGKTKLKEDFYIKQPDLDKAKIVTETGPGTWGPLKDAIPDRELDPTEKAIKAIMEALDGPGAYEAKYGAEALKKAKTESGVSFKPEPTKAYTGFDYEQMGNGKYEVFDPISGKTHVTVNTEVEAKALTRTTIESGKVHPSVDEGFAGWNKSDLAEMSPKEASEKYWEFLTKNGEYTASKFEHKYADSQKGNGFNIFSQHISKLHKENPYQQIPFEHIPHENDIPKGWSEVLDISAVKSAEKDAIDSKLSRYDKVVNTIDKVQSKLFNKMLHERAVEHFNKLQGNLPGKAKEAGYDVVAFRGLKNRDEVKSIHNYDKTGVMYSSDSPLLADMYSDYLSKHPGWSVKEGAFSEGATVAPMLINTKNYHVYDAQGKSWQEANPKAMAEARKIGSVGVIVKNVWDEPNSTRSLSQPATVFITFSKGASTMKSRFAKDFNPESKDMLHLIPVIAVGGAAGYVSKAPDPEEKS